MCEKEGRRERKRERRGDIERERVREREKRREREGKRNGGGRKEEKGREVKTIFQEDRIGTVEKGSRWSRLRGQSWVYGQKPGQ